MKAVAAGEPGDALAGGGTNLVQLQTEVKQICGNLPSAHPLYTTLLYPSSGNENQSVINRAANKFIAYAVGGNGAGADIFPELQNSWTIGPTTAATNYMSRPSDAIAITDVVCAHSSTSPNWNTAREYPMEFMDRTSFGLLTKDSTVTGYASIWTQKGKNIFFWPTPSASYIDYFREYGLKSETALVAPSDTFFMQPIWHDMVALLAASMLARKLGYKSKADDLREEFKEDLAATLNVSAMEEQGTVLEVMDMPDHSSVYR